MKSKAHPISYCSNCREFILGITPTEKSTFERFVKCRCLEISNKANGRRNTRRMKENG